MLVPRGFFAADDGGGDGGDPNDGKIKPSDVLARYGQTAESALRMAEKLAESENSNYTLREKNRTLRTERDDARTKAAPDGARVLTADEAAVYDAYTALGKPADLQVAIDTGKTHQERLATLERDATIRAASDAHGYRAAALAKLPSLVGKGLVIEDVQEDGKAVKRAFVQHEGAKLPLPDYIAQHDPEFAPSLIVEGAQASGTPFIPQGGGAKPAGDLATRYIEQQEARRKAQPNPLMPKGA
jgi:hypothetical protein